MQCLNNNQAVILVDDNPHDRFIAKKCYEKAGLQNPWIEFSAGDSLLEYLSRVEKKEQELPGLVLLDINMPRMNGFEVLQIVRSQAIFNKLPILIMLTGSQNLEDIDKSKQYGADDYIVKPSNLGEYVSFFKSLRNDVSP